MRSGTSQRPRRQHLQRSPCAATHTPGSGASWRRRVVRTERADQSSSGPLVGGGVTGISVHRNVSVQQQVPSSHTCPAPAIRFKATTFAGPPAHMVNSRPAASWRIRAFSPGRAAPWAQAPHPPWRISQPGRWPVRCRRGRGTGTVARRGTRRAHASDVPTEPAERRLAPSPMSNSCPPGASSRLNVRSRGSPPAPPATGAQPPRSPGTCGRSCVVRMLLRSGVRREAEGAP